MAKNEFVLVSFNLLYRNGKREFIPFLLVYFSCEHEIDTIHGYKRSRLSQNVRPVSDPSRVHNLQPAVEEHLESGCFGGNASQQAW